MRWEVLANLRAGTDAAGPPHPARASDARARATMATREDRKGVPTRLTLARRGGRELKRLPDQLTDGISDRDARIRERRRLEVTTARRLSGASRDEPGDRRRAETSHMGTRERCCTEPRADREGQRAHLHGARSQSVLREQGFAVADVHSEVAATTCTPVAVGSSDSSRSRVSGGPRAARASR